MSDYLAPDDLPDIRPGDTVRKPRGTVVWTVTGVERWDLHTIARLRSTGRRDTSTYADRLVLLARDPTSVREVPPWADSYLHCVMDQIATDVEQETADVDPVDLITEQGWKVKYLPDIDGRVIVVRCAHLIIVDPDLDRSEIAERIWGILDPE